VRLLGALDVETHEARELAHVVRGRASAHPHRRRSPAPLPLLQAVAETLLSSLIEGGAIKPTEVAERDGATGA
jgi:hypothetical protein